MPLELQKRFNAEEPLLNAARRRVTDSPNVEYTKDEVDSLARLFLRRNEVLSTPQLRPGGLTNTSVFNTFLKDTKFSVGQAAETSASLENEINNFRASSIASLLELQSDILGLDSEITEEEQSRLFGFNEIHFNQWVRAIDAPKKWANSTWLVDPKTGRTWLPVEQSDFVPGSGLTLPLVRETPLLISNVVLVGEETSVGSTHLPLVETDPVALLKPDRVFRYVVAKQHADSTSKLYYHEPTYCTLLFELGAVQQLNTVRVKPIGTAPVRIVEISYINTAGEEVQLDTTTIDSSVYTTLFFEPVRTKYLRIKFVQDAAVSHEVIQSDDVTKRKLNDVLSGLGWTQQLTEAQVYKQCRVYDFSLESVELLMRQYRGAGVFESQDIVLQDVMAIALDVNTLALTVSEGNAVYSNLVELPDGVVFNESYCGLTVLQDGAKAYEALLPVPDVSPVQTEYLPLVGKVASAKLFPDLFYSAERLYIESAVYDGSSLLVSFLSPHGLVDNNFSLGFVAPGDETELSFLSTDWMVVDSTSIQVNDYTGTVDLSEFAPAPFAYLADSLSFPVKLYADQTELTVGEDYDISLDGGSSWLTSLPVGAEVADVLRNKIAGEFKVRIYDPQYAKLYWIEYLPAATQWLDESKLVELRNGRIVLPAHLQTGTAHINTVMIMRANTGNSYITPIVANYFLRVNHRES